MKKAIVLLSGGLDSATTLYYAISKRYSCYCLAFDYGQRHKREIASAKKIAARAGCKLRIIKINLPWKGSSLLDKARAIPSRLPEAGKIPSTYVPGRNIIFLSFAVSYAEAIRAQTVFIGANAIDYSGYPDCRPEFFEAFNEAVNKGTKFGASGVGINIKTPLIGKSKKEIVELAHILGVPLKLTWSCYMGAAKPCGVCDSCVLRERGFKEARFQDPALKG